MSWIKDKEDDNRSWIQKLCTSVLKQGPIPQHVGFILDGNRRYAKGKNLKHVEGHRKGFDKLAETLRWCLDFGITEVTVYVFSIENFKRPKEEVDGLMKLAAEKFHRLLEEEEKIMEEGICIQIVGDWSLVPDDLRPLMAKAMIMTRYNTKAKLNVAFAYTSRNEITRGIQSLHQGLVSGDILEEDLNTKILEDTFQILPTKPLELLVRTSGETRLSDFLLWQSTETVLCFSNVLWPDFTYWHLLSAVFHYQINRLHLNDMNLKPSNEDRTNSERESRQNQFLENFRDERWRILAEDASRVSIPCATS